MRYTEKQYIKTSVKPENFLRHLRNRIRQASDFEEIITLIVTELRLFVEIDRVMLYKFHPDASGQVIAESTNSDRLPSLLGLNFPPDDIPPSICEEYIKSRMRSVVNVDTRQIGHSKLVNSDTGEFLDENINYRSVDPCHLKYLDAMGVKVSLVVPIIYQDKLWGLFVFHHSEPYVFTNVETGVVEIVAEDLSVAITQNYLLTQVKKTARCDIIVNSIANRLHSFAKIEFQSALQEIVEAFPGQGGRLCILDKVLRDHNGDFWSFTKCLETGSDYVQTYTYGQQPIITDTSYPLMEQFSVWQEYYKSKKYDVWAISDIYQTPELQDLQSSFQSTKIRGILMIPVHYRQQLLGYMSIFRDEVDTVTFWAGEFEPGSKQMYPRKSFEVWRQSKKAQAPEWTAKDIELAQALGKQFANVIHENHLHQYNSILGTQQQERINKLSQVIEEQRNNFEQLTQEQNLWFEVVTQIHQLSNVDTIFETTIKKIAQLIKAESTAVYRFNPDKVGEFVYYFTTTDHALKNSTILGTTNLWNYSYLQQIKRSGYDNHKAFAVDDIYKVGLSDYDIKTLEQFSIMAYVIVPIFVGRKLWGLLAAYQHSQPRTWKTSDIRLLSQATNLFAVTLRQAELIARNKQMELELQPYQTIYETLEHPNL